MSRIITFSRTFPGYHRRKGQPTHFVEKIYNDLAMPCDEDLPEYLMHLNPHISALHIIEFCKSLDWKGEAHGWPKRHTIRSGHRWKVGDKFSPRVWSGRPYHSPQIIFAPDIELKKVWEFDIKEGHFYLNKNRLVTYYAKEMISKNDGLSYGDFKDWFQFPKPFSGQVLCWDENVNY